MHIKKIGQGKDLVLIHGWGMHSGIWEPIIDRFSNQYTLHLVDIPGMGKSHVINPYDLDHVTEEISKALPPSFDILGWSLGSLIAIKMSLMYPKKIHRMVLVGGTPCFINQTDWSYGVDIRDFNNFANNLFKNYKSTMINFYILQLMHSKNSKLIIKKLKEMEAVENPLEIKSLQLGLDILLNNDLRNDINKIKHQTLLITGDMDRLTPKSASIWLESHLKESQLKLIKGASHIPFLSHSDEFFNCLDQFLLAA
ncbi:pimeloyl-ACP methyl ester esterase BioH [Candidatus Methylopumilus planktonicus]|uniref:pimeloyl-ACP methyl ester esterase BioH n=1 Tax=Candidatus Methylopumilus planktonicus TaxID=1581557 RepID=UPI001121536B|nr:pimeloyl-ACP methyl ester esterase BioH [Candidatus Methylopumilus planktonicus]QDD06573.1 pimeloyl-ACP methyl ester esterase BioH [Candidatus Methylopumilus planktonicus]QDD07908.1 pimeloyl-ACP methyl ester esterase BioH [Candidatus Methylopumilus planktonicus]QDD09234.1 pimeloyl-ACP methyl ester esterase BioH [Candidatus Methylopumilus planktonicus]